MEKAKFLLHKKIIFLVFLIFALANNSAFSQCVNPTPTGANSQVFCKTDNSTIADLVASGGTIVWYDAPSGGEFYGTAEVLVNGKTYYADDISDDSCSTSRLAVVVTIYGDFPTNVDVSVGKCAIDNPTIASLSAIGENIEWFDAQTGGNLLPHSQLLESGKTYWVQQTENGCTSARFPTIVSLINPLTPTTAPIQSFCSLPSATVANLRAMGTTILWYDSETSTTPLKTNIPLINGEDYWAAEITFPCVSSNRAQTTVVFDMAPNAGESSTLAECEVNFTTTNLFDLLGGTPYKTGIWTGPSALSNGYLGTFEPGINTIGTYTYTVSSTLGICPPDSSIIAIALVVVPPPTTANAVQAFCEIENATINDLSTNESNVVWYDTETSTIALNPSEAIVNGEDYWGALPGDTSGCLSTIRLKITANITVIPPPTTANVNQVFCTINNPTIANLIATGTGILWYASETSTTPLNDTEVLIDGASYWASQIDAASGCESATRLVVNVTVITPQPPITISQSKTFCEIEKATIANLNEPGNVLLWYATETSTTPLNATDLLVDGSIYWATQTIAATGCEITNRLKVTISIIKIIPPTTTQPNQIFCEIENAKISDLNASGSGILWYATETSTTPINAADLLVNGASYWATQTNATSGCESASRLAITVVINATPPPTTTNENQTFCIKDYLPNAPTIANLSASGSGILWYATATSTSPLNNSTVLLDGTAYWATQTNVTTGCESVLRLLVNVSIINPATPTTTSINQAFCAADKPTVASLQANGTSIIWYANETSVTPLNSNDLLINGEDYWAANANVTTGCESIIRLKVTVSITDVAPVTIVNISQTFCESDAPTIANLAATGNGILWYATQTSAIPMSVSTLLINGSTYWAAQSNTATGCISSVRVIANVTLTAIPTPTLISLGNEFCKINNPTISDLNLNVSANNGGTISWYDAFPNGNLLNASTALDEGETYYAIETTVNGCKSINPLEVTITLEACYEYDVEIYDGFSPTGNGTNDTFKIKNLRELYPDFKVEFFNRWGNLIYTANASNGDWNGRLNGDGELSPAGVYFFIVYFNKENRKPIQRSLYLSR
jgi:gliding motility-associated-like protein